MDELHGILTAYEMRIEKKKSGLREAIFKVSKKTGRHKGDDYSHYDLDAKRAQFVRRLKRRFGKYKDKIPLNYFNCGRIGNFVAKFPSAK